MLRAFENYDRPFEYGTFDCCQFVSACVNEMKGKNPMSIFDYENEAEAYKIINRFGSLIEAIDDTLGADARTDDPQDGDVSVHDSPLGQLAGIVYRGRCVVKTKSGIMDWPLQTAVAFWRT